MVNKELLDELKQILIEDYKLNLTAQEVVDLAHLLVNSFTLLVKNHEPKTD